MNVDKGAETRMRSLFLEMQRKDEKKQRRGMDGNVPYCQIVCSPLPVLSLLSTLSMPVEVARNCTYTWHYSEFFINVRCHDMPMILELWYQRWRLKSRRVVCTVSLAQCSMHLGNIANGVSGWRCGYWRPWVGDMSSDDVTKLLMEFYPPPDKDPDGVFWKHAIIHGRDNVSKQFSSTGPRTCGDGGMAWPDRDFPCGF